jgi:nitrogen fixation-related uncharacterized protein
VNDAERTTERAKNNRGLQVAARAGFVAYGIVYLLIGWLALRLAWGNRSGSADTSGALRTLAGQPLGRVLLVVVAIGLLALAVWQGFEAAIGCRQYDDTKRARKRVAAGGKAVAFAVIGVSALRITAGAGSSSTKSEQKAASGVLSLPGGQVIVLVAAAVVAVIGIVQVVEGIKKSFEADLATAEMSPGTRSAVATIGTAGYVARGVAFALIGVLLGYAAVTADPKKANGLDGALHTVLGQPFGRYLLTVVAIGLAAAGVFAFAEARYRRL